MKEQGFPLATEIIKLQKFIIKALIILLGIALVLWFGTCGLFVWYLNQYDFTGSSESTVELTNQDGDNGNINVNGNVVNGTN